jgi:hypothetical protein
MINGISDISIPNVSWLLFLVNVKIFGSSDTGCSNGGSNLRTSASRKVHVALL